MSPSSPSPEVSAAEAPLCADFVAMAAHELRGPATVIAGAAETLQHLLDRDTIGPQAHEMLTMLGRNARHLRKLAVDVLSSVYLERGDLPLKMGHMPVLPIIRWAVAASHPPSDGAVRVDCDPGLSATVDADQLEQILTNLVANGLEHGAAPVVVSARATTDATVTVISVRDSGDGVPARDAPALFDRFSALATRTSTSTGLGLSISRSLARAMGGDLIYRAGDEGSTFVLTLRAA